MILEEWISTFPQLQVSLLKRSLSNHCPLLISSSSQNWGPKPFRFQNMWLSHPGCLKLIQEVWAQHNKSPLNEKLRHVKTSLKD